MGRAQAYMFNDAMSGKYCVLLISTRKIPLVIHSGCLIPADVSIELDAFYCTECHFNGRISGALVAGLIAEATSTS